MLHFAKMTKNQFYTGYYQQTTTKNNNIDLTWFWRGFDVIDFVNQLFNRVSMEKKQKKKVCERDV